MNYYNYPSMGAGYGNMANMGNFRNMANMGSVGNMANMGNVGATANQAGVLGSLVKNKFNWSSLLDTSQKTLNVINQSIPIFKQAQPIYKNAKTMFRVMNEFKKEDGTGAVKQQTPQTSNVNNTKINQTNNIPETAHNNNDNQNEYGPQFFL